MATVSQPVSILYTIPSDSLPFKELGFELVLKTHDLKQSFHDYGVKLFCVTIEILIEELAWVDFKKSPYPEY